MNAATRIADVLTPDQVDHYQKEGYVILPKILPDDLLELLRDGCQLAKEQAEAATDKRGLDALEIWKRTQLSSLNYPSRTNPRVHSFIYGPFMESIARSLLGDTLRLVFEHYMLKYQEKGATFAWHQDSGYIPYDIVHKPYLTCWCALDDMSEANGTVYILPQSRSGIRGRVEHEKDPESNNMVGYFGSDPGDPVICPAGSIALFNSITFHRSGWNRSPKPRRAFVVQYAGADIGEGGEPFMVDGQHVAAITG